MLVAKFIKIIFQKPLVSSENLKIDTKQFWTNFMEVTFFNSGTSSFLPCNKLSISLSLIVHAVL